jgi:Fe-S cluster assembly protein SufD
MMKESEGNLIRQLVRDHQPAVRSSDSNPWLQVLKKEAASWVSDMTLPNRKMEAWRYTPVDFIDSSAFADVEEGPFEALALTDIEELLLPDSEFTDRIVFVNGYYAPALSSLSEQDGVELYTLEGKRKLPAELKRRIGQADLSDHFFFTLNNALISDGAVIHVSREAAQQHRRIELLHVTVGMPDPVIHNPRHLVVLESGAALELVERYASLGKSGYFNNAVVDIQLSEGASLLHTRLQEESEHAQHLTYLNVNLETGSHYEQVSLALGGAWSRTEARILFSGEHAHAELDGLILAGSKQLNDVHLEVLHEVPNCTSREHFKGLLDGNGKIVFDGRILVGRDAQKTEAALNNENLMLSRSAEVDTKPQLEIFADDVKCSHGATVGELDKEMLFYLRSRGISKADAERMLCTAFADEVIAAISGPAIRDHVKKVVLRRLADQGKTS